MPTPATPPGLAQLLNDAWNKAKQVEGFLTETEARFLGIAAALKPNGRILEIGSFKGKSTVILATVARHYGLGPVTAIDPFNFASPELANFRAQPGATSFDAFTANIARAGVADNVDVRRAYSTDLAPTWNQPIAFLWIDGNHTYSGAKADLDGFLPHVVPGGIVAFHDALHAFEGPIRVFVEDILRSNRFGPAGFVGSIAWAQLRPRDGAAFHAQRARLDRIASRLLPYVANDSEPSGIRKLLYKLQRSRVPRAAIEPEAFAKVLANPQG